MQRLLLFLTSLLAVLSVNGLQVNGPPSNPSLELGLEQVEARRGGGGRSRGGSFGRSRGSSRSRSNNRSSGRIGGSSRTGSGSFRFITPLDFVILIVLLILFLLFLPSIIRQLQEFEESSYNYKDKDKPVEPNPSTWGNATVTKLQVALLGQVDHLHTELLKLSQRRPRTSSDRAQLLQDTALTLLRNPESWTHIWANSIHYNQAERVDKAFQHLSLLEQRQNSPEPSPNAESEYVLVTLLLVSDHLQPIFSPVHSEEEQKQALETLAALDSQCLGKLEVYIHPNQLGKNLTKEELVSQNSHIISL